MPSRLRPAQVSEFARFAEAVLTAGSVASIESELSQLQIRPPFRLRMKVLYGGRDPLEGLQQLCGRRDVSRGYHPGRSRSAPEPWRLERPAAGVPGFVLTGAVGRDTVRDFRIPFAVLPTDEPNIRLAIAVCSSAHWTVLLRFFSKHYPVLVPIYLSQRELIEGVRAYRDASKDFDIRVREYSATERGQKGQFRRSVREWTDEDLRSVLTQVYERQQVIRSIKLAFHRRIGDRIDVTPSLDARVTKTGEVEVTGRYDLARETIVKHMVAVGAEKLRFYRGRGLRERQYKVAPLKIDFRKPVLSEHGEPARLLEVLRRLPNAMYSVQHGNPYLHLRVLDGFDGSGFDIWAVSGQSLVLVPRQKATEASIERVIHHLFDHFREGDVSDFVVA